MPYLLNLLYLALLLCVSPWLLYKALTTGKYRHGMWRKFRGLTWERNCRTGFQPVRPTHSDGLETHPTAPLPAKPVAWFHGVSVGEVILLRQIVAAFRHRHPDWQCVVSTTTDTGFAEAQQRFADLPVFFWPFDFTWAVGRALQRVQPSVVILAESEVWPNFVMAARRRGVPMVVVNGRMSPRSFARYRKLGGLVRWLFRSVDLWLMQTEEYTQHVRLLGGPRAHTTGNIKFDGALTQRDNPRTLALRQLLHVQPPDLVWIVGSTQAPEEEYALSSYRRLRQTQPTLRLILVPRQRERFDEVAALLQRSGEAFVRRSSLTAPLADPRAIVLVDTIGELGALWGLADVAFVGGSMDGKRGGQNMIEPAAYGAAVLFGPHVWNFKDTVNRLLEQRAAVQVADEVALDHTVAELLGDAPRRRQMGAAAQRFVLAQQGATQRTLDLLDAFLHSRQQQTRAA